MRNYVRVARPQEPIEPVVRFETPAGHQGQVDFGTFALPWGRRHALVVVLGYARSMKARLKHSLNWATCSLVRQPPTTTHSSLQSN